MEKEFYKILHLDAGRKYFRPETLKQLIDNMAECGYTQLQLAVGNDGLRLLLDDMAMDGKDSDTVKTLVREGNMAYNQDPSALTQAEMDELLAYAKEKGVEIAPLVNVPGHMRVALNINPSYRFTCQGKTSVGTIDVRREEACEFGVALILKYAAYFASRGCRYFSFGADEYANDAFNEDGLGFALLEGRGELHYLIAFINRAAEAVLACGMTPRAFNDPFYYHEDTTMDLNKAVQVCYWCDGWRGFHCAKVKTIADMGHDMINTRGGWYYVLGEKEVIKPSKHAEFETFAANSFSGGQIFDGVAGAMFCIWCDHSNLLTDAEVVADVAEEMKAMYGKIMG